MDDTPIGIHFDSGRGKNHQAHVLTFTQFCWLWDSAEKYLLTNDLIY